MQGEPRSLNDIDSRTLRGQSGKLLVIPVGALEAHGPHLPLGTDLIQAESTARALANVYDCVVAPGLPYGVCPGTKVFPGTISISPATLSSLIYDVAEEFYRTGFRRFLVISGHGSGGHMASLRDGMEHLISHHSDAMAVVLCDYDFVYELRGKEAPLTDGHGGLLETSRLMALAPDLVGKERPVVDSKAKRFLVGDPSPKDWPESVIGDTRNASAQLGHRIQKHVMKRLVETLDESFGSAK